MTDPVDAELDVLLARAGIEVPDTLLAGVRTGYRDLRRLADLLHTRRSAYHEPSAAYRMRPADAVPDD
jgi:hypothetical protein